MRDCDNIFVHNIGVCYVSEISRAADENFHKRSESAFDGGSGNSCRRLFFVFKRTDNLPELPEQHTKQHYRD